MDDLSDAILQLASPYTVTRRAANGYGSDGRAIAPTTSTVTVQAVVEPLKGKDVARLPEGLRTRRSKVVFTPTQLYAQEGGQNPDRISIDGEAYEVQAVERWYELGGFYRAVVVGVSR
jgi:hypothetical protein